MHFFFRPLADDVLFGPPSLPVCPHYFPSGVALPAAPPQNWDQESADSEEDAIGGADDMSDDDDSD